MQHRMSEIAVCEGVRTVFQPDDQSVEFAKGADARVVNEAVNHHICYNKTECCIDHMGKCNPPPGSVEFVPIPLCFWIV